MHTFTTRVGEYFKARPNVWIDGREFEAVGGRYAWRSRISDARQGGMRIENRQRRARGSDGRPYVISEYRYVPADDGFRLTA